MEETKDNEGRLNRHQDFICLLVHLIAHLHHRCSKLKDRNRHATAFAQSHILCNKTLSHICFTNTTLLLPFDPHTDHISQKKKDNTNKKTKTKTPNNKAETQLFMPGAQI